MELTRVIVQVDRTQLNTLQTDIQSLRNTTLRINVEAPGLENVSRNAVQLINAQARLARAENELAVQREKTAQATQRRLTAEARLATQAERTATAQVQLQTQTERTATTEAQLALQTERTATAQVNLATQVERTATAQAQAAVQTERTATAQVNLAAQTERAAAAQVQLQTQQERSTQAMQRNAAQMQRNHQGLTGLIGNIAKFAQWYIIGNTFSAIVRSMTDALDTMKAVDQELTNIQKVSNITADELNKLGDAAYSTASKYGVAAEEYLSAVYTFEKAGLGDSSAQLGELATKTMLVGDTTADVASKFLIAVNSAWELGGSMERLSKVVDEADYINNNYATDLEKLSAGMPIVASTAANMNMSLEETLAVLGTITARTQESGTKAATAWRALAMNIAGEIGTITDETGETIEVTEESVKSLSDALKIYGNEAVQMAQRTGQVINPMEAVISLAEAYKDNLLTDIELENILMGVGGKLRTNQLTALVKDLASETSIYYDIMAKLPEAAGTADAEIAIMLDSWNAKTQRLKNSWTEFFATLVNTKTVKTFLDNLTYGFDDLAKSMRRITVSQDMTLVRWKEAKKALDEYQSVLGNAEAEKAWRAKNEESLRSLLQTIDEHERAGNEIPLRWYDIRVAIEGAIGATKTESSALQELQSILDGINAQNIIAELEKIRNSALSTSQQIIATYQALAKIGVDPRAVSAAVARGEAENLNDYLSQLAATTVPKAVTTSTASTKTSSSSKSSSKSTTDPELEKWKAALSYAKNYYSFLENSGATQDKLDEQARKVQNALHDVAEYLRSIGKGEQETIEYSAEWWTWQNKITDAAKKNAEAQEKAAEEARKAAEEAQKAELQSYKDAVALEQTRLTFIQKAGLSNEQQISQMEEIKNALIAQLDYMSSIGASANDILAVGNSLLGVQNDIVKLEKEMSEVSDDEEKAQNLRLQYLKDTVSLRESELTLMQARGDGEEEQGAKMRQILDALEQQAAYMREIGKSQEEINNLATKAWNTYRNILEAQQNSFDALVESANAYIDAQEEAVKGPMQEQLDLLKAQHEEQEVSTTLAEKQLAVEKAQIALRNARGQRNIRTYNATSGQFEWVANQKAVQSAEEALLAAQEALAEYQYELQIKALQSEIDRVEETFDALRDAIEYAAKGIRSGEMTYAEAYAYIGSKMQGLYDAHGDELTQIFSQYDVDLSEVMEKSVQGWDDAAAGIAAANAMFQTVQNSIGSTLDRFGNITGQIDDTILGFGSLNSELDEAKYQLEESVDGLSDASRAIRGLYDYVIAQVDGIKSGKTQEIYASSGSSDDDYDGGSSTSSSSSSSSAPYGSEQYIREQIQANTQRDLEQMKANSAAWHTASEAEKQRLNLDNMRLGSLHGWFYDAASGIWYESYGGKRLYDSGGVLQGMGGIKATSADEVILPPDVSRAFLEPNLTARVAQSINEMGILTGARPITSIGASFGTTNRIGTQNNGDTFILNGVDVSEHVTRSTSLGDLARIARNLPIYS